MQKRQNAVTFKGKHIADVLDRCRSGLAALLALALGARAGI